MTKNEILDTLKTKWTSDLLDFELFVNLADSEKYVEKLVKVGRLFLKNSKKEKKYLKKVMQILCCDVGGSYFFLFLAFF